MIVEPGRGTPLSLGPGLERELLARVPRVVDLVGRLRVGAQPEYPEPTARVGRRGRRPEDRPPLRIVGQELVLEVQPGDADDDPRGRLALDVDQPALDGLLGRQGDRRLLARGIRLEVDRRQGPPGRGGDQAQVFQATRGNGRDIQREPAVGVGHGGAHEDAAIAAVDVAGLVLPVGQYRDAGVGDRLAPRVEDAADDRHPGGIGVVRRRARGRRWPCGHSALHLGLIAHRERAGEPAGAGGDDGQEHQRDDGGLELVDQHGTDHLLGQCRGGSGEHPAGGVTGREGDRGPGGGIAQEGMRRTPRPIGRAAPRPSRWSTARSPRRVRPRRSFSRARANRLRSVPTGHRSRCRRLVEGEALEVAEHHRQAEGAWQSVDLAVQRLGLFAIEEDPVGRRGGSRLGLPRGSGLLGPATAAEPEPGASRRATARRRRASCPAAPARATIGPWWPGRGRRPGRRPRPGGGRPGAGGRRPAPSARGGRRARRRRPHRGRPRTAQAGCDRRARRPNHLRRASRADGPATSVPRVPYRKPPGAQVESMHGTIRCARCARRPLIPRTCAFRPAPILSRMLPKIRSDFATRQEQGRSVIPPISRS